MFQCFKAKHVKKFKIGPQELQISTSRILCQNSKLHSRTSNTLVPHYNTHFGVHSDISVITEQPYNEGLIHRKHKQ